MIKIAPAVGNRQFTKAMVKLLLTKASLFEWSLQGFGMLRTYIDDFRINVWDTRYRVPNVSLIHDHPWNFTSLIVVGRLGNIRFVERPYSIGGEEKTAHGEDLKRLKRP